MPRLHELQGALGRAILAEDAGSIAEAKLGAETILGDEASLDDNHRRQ